LWRECGDEPTREAVPVSRGGTLCQRSTAVGPGPHRCAESALEQVSVLKGCGGSPFLLRVQLRGGSGSAGRHGSEDPWHPTRSGASNRVRDRFSPPRRAHRRCLVIPAKGRVEKPCFYARCHGQAPTTASPASCPPRRVLDRVLFSESEGRHGQGRPSRRAAWSPLSVPPVQSISRLDSHGFFSTLFRGRPRASLDPPVILLESVELPAA
jgi:hypothetical protein